MERRIVTRIEELASIRGDWESLLARSDGSQPTLAPDWQLAWWRVFGGDGSRSLRAVTLWEDGRLVGVAPLLARNARVRGIPFRRIEPLASGEDASDETCSDYLGVLAERGREAAVVGSVVDAIERGGLGEWDDFVLPSSDASARTTRLLASELAAIGARVAVDDSNGSPYVPLGDTWASYLEKLPSAKRHLVRRALRDFQSWTGEAPSLDVVDRREDVLPTLGVLAELHGERWQGGGAFASPRFRSFHEDVAPRLFDRGALDLGVLRAHGRPVAAFYVVVWDGRAQFYQSGRSLDVPKGVRVGIVMHALLLQRSIARGLREYDFLAGTSRYKMDLALATRPLATIRAARPSLAEAALVAAEATIRGTRTLRASVSGVLRALSVRDPLAGPARADERRDEAP